MIVKNLGDDLHKAGTARKGLPFRQNSSNMNSWTDQCSPYYIKTIIKKLLFDSNRKVGHLEGL